MKRTRWVERQFNFGLPIGVFPCVIERLRGTPARLEELVRSFPPKILTIRVDNKWSIQEHIGHLIDLEEVHEGRIDDFKARQVALRPADVTNRKTSEANYNARSVQHLLPAFRAGRMHFVMRLTELDDETLSISALHPRLQQTMRVVDMAYFVAEHDDHHLASITELSKILQSGA